MGVAAVVLNNLRIAGIERKLEDEIKNKEDICVAEKAVQTRGMILEESIKKDSVPKRFLHPQSILWKDKGMIVGQRVANPLRQGQPILWSDMLEKSKRTVGDSILPTHSVVTVPVDMIGGVGGLISPGSRVDVIGIFNSKYLVATDENDAAKAALEKADGEKLNPEDLRSVGEAMRKAQKLAEEQRKKGSEGDKEFVVTVVARNLGVFAAGTATQMDADASDKRGVYSNISFAVDHKTRMLLIMANEIVQEGGGRMVCVLRSNEGASGDQDDELKPASSKDFLKLIRDVNAKSN